jgi:hypothetical protein
MKKIIYLLLSIVLLQTIACKKDTNGNTTTVTVVPIAPTTLIGQAVSTSKINLAWTDNSTNEDGFKIERKIAGGTYAVIATTAANITNYTDSNLVANKAYTYRVYAFNAAGSSLTYTNEVTISTQDPIAQTINNGLVAYYPFNGNANDESGNGNNGTVNGATLTTDRNGDINAAYSFNGTNNIISIANPFFNGQKVSQFTISAYFYLNSLPAPNKNSTIWAKNGFWQAVGIDVSDNGRLAFGGSIPSPQQYQSISSQPNIVQVNKWNNVTILYNNNNCYMYLNGTMVASSNSMAGYCDFGQYAAGNSNSTNLIGCSNSVSTGNVNFLNGVMGGFSIYNRVLSAAEVAYLATH